MSVRLLLLIGAQKCATTYFADLLSAHPEIALATPKEPDFFTLHYDRGWDWYRGLFPYPGPVLLDASTSYTAAPTKGGGSDADSPTSGVPARMKSMAPDARLVYLVRDPVERTYSGYWHSVRAGEETRPFEAAIKANRWYLDISRYHAQASLYLEHFSPDQLCIMQTRDMSADPGESARRVWRHAGISDRVTVPQETGRKNTSYQYNRVGKLLIGLAGSKTLAKTGTRLAKRLLPARVVTALKAGMTDDIPPITTAQADWVYDQLKEDVERFYALTGIDFRR